MTCAHEDFAVFADVARLTKVEGGPVTGYSADLKIECVQCGERFVFIGLPPGINPRGATGSMDGVEARLPIRPSSAPEGWGEDNLSVSVRYTGSELPGGELMAQRRIHHIDCSMDSEDIDTEDYRRVAALGERVERFARKLGFAVMYEAADDPAKF